MGSAQLSLCIELSVCFGTDFIWGQNLLDSESSKAMSQTIA